MFNAYFSQDIHRGGTYVTPSAYEVAVKTPAPIPSYMTEKGHPTPQSDRVAAWAEAFRKDLASRPPVWDTRSEDKEWLELTNRMRVLNDKLRKCHMQTGNNHLWACRDLVAKWIQLNRARWTQTPGPMQKVPRMAETVRSHLGMYWRVYDRLPGMPDTTRSLSGETWAREFALNRPRYYPHPYSINGAPVPAAATDTPAPAPAAH